MTSPGERLPAVAGWAALLVVIASSVGCLAHGDGRARLVQAPAAATAALSARVEHVKMPIAAVWSGDLRGTLRVEAELTNRGTGELRLAPADVGLTFASPGRAGGPVRLSPARLGVGDETPGSEIRLAPGARLPVWFEWKGVPAEADPDGLPKRVGLELRAPGERLELVLADPAAGSPRWELPRPRSSTIWSGMGLFAVGADTLGVVASFMGTAVALGPVVLRSSFDIVINSNMAGFALDVAVGWTPFEVGDRSPRTRSALGPYLGGRSMVLSRLAEPPGDPGSESNRSGPAGGLVGLEVGISFVNAVDRLAHGPFPLTRPLSPVGTAEQRLAYVHWFGEELGPGGAPGFALRLGHALF
jgi:hypothetical protein